MSICNKRIEELSAEIDWLRSRLKEADETLDAIRNGDVDAIVVSGTSGDQVYSLTGTDQAYRVLFETMSEGAAILDSNGMILFCNAALSGLLKIPMERLLGQSILPFIALEDRESFEIQLRQDARTSHKAELALKSADGNVVQALISMERLSIDDVATYCLVATDITAVKQTKVKLHENEEQLRAIFEGSQVPIFAKDTNRAFTRANPASERLFGHPPHKLIGRRREDLAGNTQEIKHAREVDLRVLSGQTVEEQRIVSIGGAKSVWKIVQMPLYGASGEVIGLCGIARDITDWARDDASDQSIYPDSPYPSEAMRSTLRIAEVAAGKGFTILLLGESGSGKDYVAKYIHDHSKRGNGPYFSINCAAITSGLAESELFGHEKGAFTGAVARKRGFLELAEGGTLLLNEIGDLSLPLQSKLLTFLDTKKFARVGGEKEIATDVRLIAATNKDLEQEVKDGKFRLDLFYRLNAITLKIPPLRERIEDIPILIQQILAKLRTELQIQDIPTVTPAAMNSLKRYRWPGNVRELRNVIERSVILSQGQELDLAEVGFGTEKPEELVTEDANDSLSFKVSFPIQRSLQELTHELKRFLIREALRWSGDSRQEAARLLGVSRFALRRQMKALGWENEE